MDNYGSPYKLGYNVTKNMGHNWTFTPHTDCFLSFVDLYIQSDS
jgi:hypothetical protein